MSRSDDSGQKRERGEKEGEGVQGRNNGIARAVGSEWTLPRAAAASTAVRCGGIGGSKHETTLPPFSPNSSRNNLLSSPLSPLLAKMQRCHYLALGNHYLFTVLALPPAPPACRAALNNLSFSSSPSPRWSTAKKHMPARLPGSERLFRPLPPPSLSHPCNQPLSYSLPSSEGGRRFY